MKTYFTILVCLIANAVAAQTTFERTYQNGSSTYSDFIANDAGYLVIGSGFSDSLQNWNRLNFVRQLDYSGNVLWQKTFENYEFINIDQRIASLSYGYILWGYGGCDVLSGNLAKLNHNGDTMWTNSNWEIYDPNNIIGISNGDLLVSHYDGITRLDSLGSIKWQRPVVAAYLTAFSGERSVVAGGNTVQILDSLDNVALTYLLPSNSQALKVFGDSICVFANKIAYVFDENLNLAYSLSFLGKVTEIADFAKDANGWYILDKKTNNEVFFRSFNQMGSLIYSYSLGKFYPNYLPKMTISNNAITVLGNRFYEKTLSTNPSDNYSSFVPFLKTFETQIPSSPATNDVEVLEIDFDLHAQVSGCYSTNDRRKLKWENIRALVRNNGTDTLQTLELNTRRLRTCGFGCDPSLGKNASFAGLNLAPNDTVWLTLGDYEFWGAPIRNEYDLCVWAVAPNNHLDADQSNNHACEVRIPTATQDQTTRAIQNIFPNPATDQIRIELGETQTVQNATVFNLLGQVVAQRTFGETTHFIDLSVAELQPAFYVVILETETGRFVGKFLKE